MCQAELVCTRSVTAVHLPPTLMLPQSALLFACFCCKGCRASYMEFAANYISIYTHHVDWNNAV